VVEEKPAKVQHSGPALDLINRKRTTGPVI